MEIIELNKITEKIKKDFIDPLETGELIEFLTGSSKRIRSKLVILYLKASGIKINDDICELLAAGEIIHNSSLLHDDVLDDTETRRGKPSIGKLFSPKLSILAGDYLLSYALEKLLKLNNQELFTIFKNCTKEMIEGEIKQYFLRGKIPEFDLYLEICRMKTASLFEAMAEGGAVLSDLPRDNFKNFARKFGVFFQMKNDLEETSSLNDKKNGIYTIKDILGIEKTYSLLDNYREEMRSMLSVLPESMYKTDLEDLFKKS